MDVLKSVLLGAALLAPVIAGAQDLAPVALNSLSAMPQGIRSARVLDQHGNYLGNVQHVAADQYGKPLAISILPKGGHLTVVSASAVSYDESRNVLVASIPAHLLAAK
jgi:hypothetical protein